MLRVVAHYHPIDFMRLKRVLREWRGGLDYETYRQARDNLLELDLIYTEPHEEHIQLTQLGWERLGGETSFDSE